VLVTTYPLFLQNQIWSAYDLSESRVPFVSMASEGTYNALRSILFSAQADQSDDGEAELCAGADDLPLDYREPFESSGRRPPVWLTVATPSGYWPLAVLGDKDLNPDKGLPQFLYSWPMDETESETRHTQRAPVIEGVSRLWYSLAFGLTGVCVVLLLALRGQWDCCVGCSPGRSSCCGEMGRAGKLLPPRVSWQGHRSHCR
jgi:hypothetical protein